MKELITIDRISKNDISIQRDQILDKIKSGELTALQVLAVVKAYDTLLNDKDGLNKTLRELAINELSQHSGRLEYWGVIAEVTELGVKYDYSHDIIWQRIQKEITDLEEKRKSREVILKACPQPDSLKGIKAMTEVTEDGEIIELLPPKKTSTTTVKVSYK